MADKKQGGELRNWWIDNGMVRGNIFNDKRFDMNERIRTSLVQKITIETENTIYTLAIEDKR